jgi:hypothetical protein
MPGASISRWTMAYFAAAIVMFATALALLALGFGNVSAAGDPDTLVVIHLVTIGWLGLLFSGALLQFVPVLAAAQPRFAWLALPALVAILGGLAGLIAGFLALGGRLDVDPAIMTVGAALLAVGFSSLIASLALTLFSRPLRKAGLFVLLGLAALAAAVLLGATFTFILSGWLDLPADVAGLETMAPVHAAFGILGWMTLTALGVSYRLFAMFMLAPETGEQRGPGVLLAALATVSVLVALPAGATLGQIAFAVAEAVALAAAAGLLVIYLADVGHMLRTRRRRTLELNSVAGLASLPFLVLGIGLLAADALFRTELPLGPTAFYILAFGWLSGLGLAQLYKIVPFLTWLETYGAAMGRAPVPRVQDLVDERRPRLWFSLYYASVAAGAAGLLAGMPLAFRVASGATLISVILIAAEFVHARRLDHVPKQSRLPPGAVRPHLIFAKVASKEE